MTVQLGERELFVELFVDTDRFMVSEPIYAEMVFRGEQGVEVEMVRYRRRVRSLDSSARADNYQLAFVDASGEELPVPEVENPSIRQSWIARVGERSARERLLLSGWFVEISPGSYTLTAKTTVRARADESAPWEEVQVSLAAPVEVIADDDAAMGAVIESIAEAAKSDDQQASTEALERLVVIRDERTLDHWLAIVEIPDYQRRARALLHLSEVDDPRAFDAIVRASQTRPEELGVNRLRADEMQVALAARLRETAARALARSDRPEALEAVLALESDSSVSVRLIVLERVSELDDSRVLPILKRMARDPSNEVRDKAVRHLRERGAQP